jgi:flagellar basal body rod protein FlgC
MTVEELLSRISSRELTEWMAFFSIEGPTGDERDDWRAGMIASTIANVNRDSKKKGSPYKPQDFMPKYEQQPAPEQRQADPGLLGFVQGMQRRMGGKLVIGE